MKIFNFGNSKWQDQVATADPITGIHQVTPVQAEILLRNNSNRQIKIGQVNRIRRDIQAGQFHITNDAIVFSADGALLNGQHRLRAIFEEGIPVRALFGFGFTREMQSAMDCGQKRSLFDVATLAGVDITKEGASIARFVRCQTMGGRVKRQATREEEMTFIEQNLGKINETCALLYPPKSKGTKGERTSIHIGNDIGAAFFRALTYFSDAPGKLAEVKRLASALIYERDNSKLSGLFESSDKPKDRYQAKVFRLLKEDLAKLNKTRLGGQDQAGRDYRYLKVEKAISMFVNPQDAEPFVIRNHTDEIFKFSEEL